MATTDVDSVVIGSGAGGLTAAVALARAGKRVLVLEQHTLPGGWCHSFDLDGYSFSPGVHYVGELGPEGRLRKIYDGLGVLGDLAFEELDPDGFDQIHIGDDPVFKVPKGRQNYADRLAERFPADADGLRSVLDLFAGLAHELGRVADGKPPAWHHGVGLPLLVRHGLRSLRSTVERRVNDPKARMVLYAMAGDHGMPPSRCPTALHAAVAGHYFDGAWYPRGGGRAIPKAFIKELRRNGGRIKVGARVAQILIEGGTAIGVRLTDGTEIRAGEVVSNADPHATAALLPEGEVPLRWRLRLPATRYSVSALSLFMAAELDPAAHGINSGNVWLVNPDTNPDAAYAYAVSADPVAMGAVPGVFLTCTSCKDPSKRHPPGIATFEAFTFVSWDAFARFEHTALDHRPRAYEALKQVIADRMLDRIEARIPGFRDKLRFCSSASPITNRHYVASTRGSMYGTEKAFHNIGPLGFGPRTPIRKLWMCGASGLAHGVSGATFSGLATAGSILHIRPQDLVAQPSSAAQAAESPRARVGSAGAAAATVDSRG